jgi:hypothetical protein
VTSDIAEAMPRPEAGLDMLAAWLLAYARARSEPVCLWDLAPEAMRVGWKRYDVHMLLSEWYRAGALILVRPGCYIAPGPASRAAIERPGALGTADGHGGSGPPALSWRRQEHGY